MTRPTYVQDGDEDNERAIANVIEKKWRSKAVKLEKFGQIDFALANDNGIVAWMEVKRRLNNHDTYPTYFISLDKIMALQQQADLTDRPAFLVVGFNDGIFYLDFWKGWPIEFDHIALGGRKDRNDAQDIEPMAHFKISKLTRIKEE